MIAVLSLEPRLLMSSSASAAVSANGDLQAAFFEQRAHEEADDDLVFDDEHSRLRHVIVLQLGSNHTHSGCTCQVRRVGGTGAAAGAYTGRSYFRGNSMIGLLRTVMVQILAVALLSVGSPIVVQAEVIGTLAGLESAQRDNDLARVDRALATAEARDQLQALGVDQAQVDARLARLTDSELSTLADKLEQAPAGGDVLAVIGVVFVVLLILEAVGVIDIFKKFP
jgi:hypothetical protein